tara:strand:- start:43 stop:474 length:432 start_codon:yes stop_codon:yes gene_type:complete
MDKQHQRLYWLWSDMKGRCSNPSHAAFKNYGGRGISVCDRWQLFDNFKHDMGLKPDGRMIDRTNNDLNYSPENCRWVTRKESNSNRRNCIYVSIKGSTVTLKEACRIAGLTYRAVHKRITKRGWAIDRALLTPIGIGNTKQGV